MGVTHSSHCVYDAHHHPVFPVKYCKALLGQYISRAILEIAKEIEDRYDLTFEKLGTDGNHIHILCSFHTKYLGPRIVGISRDGRYQGRLEHGRMLCHQPRKDEIEVNPAHPLLGVFAAWLIWSAPLTLQLTSKPQREGRF